MRALKREGDNVALTLPGDEVGDRTLSGKRIRTYDPGLGQTVEDAHDATETAWAAEDAREVAAMMRGAPILLIVHGQGHPPVSVSVGDPPENSERVIGESHVNRALGVLWGLMTSQLLATRPEDITQRGVGDHLREVRGGDWFLDLWHQALEQAADDMKQELVASEEPIDDADPDAALRDKLRDER